MLQLCHNLRKDVWEDGKEEKLQSEPETNGQQKLHVRLMDVTCSQQIWCVFEAFEATLRLDFADFQGFGCFAGIVMVSQWSGNAWWLDRK